MVSTVLRTVAQAKVSQTATTKPAARPAALNAVPKQAARLAAAIFANAAAARIALADEGLSLPEVSLPAVDIPTASGITDLLADNPILVGGGALLLAIPVGINVLLKAGAAAGGVKSTTVARALQALEEDPRVVLLDIRSKAEVKAQGSPDLRSLKRSVVSLPLTSIVKGEEILDEAFGEKFSKLRGVDEESLVILLDSDGSNAKYAAGEIEGIEKLYFVQGGAEAWEESGPWRKASKGLSLSLPNLRNVGSSINELAEDFKQAPSMTKAGLAAGAVAGAGFLLFNEIEVILELAGLFAAGNFALKLLFADEREKTFSEIKTLVDDKVAISEVGSDLNKIAKAVLEETPEGAAKPAAAAAPSAPAAAAAAADDAAAAASVPEGSSAAEAKEWIENWKAKASAN